MQKNPKLKKIVDLNNLLTQEKKNPDNDEQNTKNARQ